MTDGPHLYRALGNESIGDVAATPVAVPGQSGVSAIGSGYQSGYAVVANP